MIDYQKYHRQGHGLYKIEDLLIPSDIVKFNELADKVMSLPLAGKGVEYILSVQGTAHNENWPFSMPVSEKEHKLKLLKEINGVATQRWYTIHTDEIRLGFYYLVMKFLKKFYPELNYSNIQHQDSISVYLEDDFSTQHQDGQNQGRLCALLLYLTPEKNYNGSGDLIIIDDENNKHQISPVRGNVVLLDVANHNLVHGVDKVLGNFDRRCFLSFVWNIEKSNKGNQ